MPSFVSAASHRLVLDLYSIVGLSITSPGSHVPQHRWSQHHVSRLALMLALIAMCLAVAIHSLSHIRLCASDPRFVRSKRDPRFAQDNPWMVQIHGLRRTYICVCVVKKHGCHYQKTRTSGCNFRILIKIRSVYLLQLMY